MGNNYTKVYKSKYHTAETEEKYPKGSFLYFPIRTSTCESKLFTEVQGMHAEQWIEISAFGGWVLLLTCLGCRFITSAKSLTLPSQTFSDPLAPAWCSGTTLLNYLL
jgi:hypothetical protein